MSQDPSDAAFPVTRWSIVAQLGVGQREKQAALGELCRAYWAPLYAFARRSGNSVADAEDLVQGFLSKALQEDLFHRADSDRGKLRTFLLTTFRRYANDQRQKNEAQKRGGGKIVSLEVAGLEDWYEAESESASSPELLFDRRWAVSILTKSVAELAKRWQAKGRGEEFSILRPCLTGGGDAAVYAEIGEQCKITPENAKVRVHRLRAEFQQVLRAEVSETLLERSDIDEELRYLVSLL